MRRPWIVPIAAILLGWNAQGHFTATRSVWRLAQSKGQDTYGTDILNFTLAYRYLERILNNERVHRYLAKHDPDLFYELNALLREVETERGASTARATVENRIA